MTPAAGAPGIEMNPGRAWPWTTGPVVIAGIGRRSRQKATMPDLGNTVVPVAGRSWTGLAFFENPRGFRLNLLDFVGWETNLLAELDPAWAARFSGWQIEFRPPAGPAGNRP
jgi:hypothetical protein